MNNFISFNDIKSSEIEKKHNQLKLKLENLKYTQPLGYDSLPLIDRLVNDLQVIQNSHKNIEEVNEKLKEDKDNELKIGNPLRNQNISLVHENKLLQEEILKLRNENNQKYKVNVLNEKALKDKILEFEFLLGEKDVKIKDLEIDNLKLTKKLNEILEKVYGKQGGLENIDKLLKTDIPFFTKKKEFYVSQELHRQTDKKTIEKIEQNLLSKEEWARDLRQSELRCEKYRELNSNLEGKLSILKNDKKEISEIIVKKEEELRKFYDNYAPIDEIKYKYELENLKKQIDKVNKQNDILNNQNHELKEENHFHKHRCFKEEVSKQDKEIFNLKNEIEKLKAQKPEQIKEKINNEQAKKDDNQIFLLQERINLLEAEKKDLFEKNQELTEMSSQLQDHIKKKLEELNSTINTEKSALNGMIKKLESEISKMVIQEQDLKKKNRELVSQVDNLRAENNILKGKDVMLLKDMQEKAENVNSIYIELESQLKQNQILRDQNSNLDNLNSEIQKRLKIVTLELDSKSIEIVKVKETLKSKEDEISNLKSKYVKEGFELEKLGTTNKIIESKAKNLENEKQNYELIISNKNNRIKSLETEYGSSKLKIKELEEHILNNQIEYKSLTEEFKQSLDENRNLNEKILMLQQESYNNTFNNKLDGLEKLVSKLKNEKSYFEKEFEVLSNKLKLNNEKNFSLSEENQNLKIQLEFSKTESEKKIINLEDEIVILQNKLSSFDQNSYDVNKAYIDLKEEINKLTIKNNNLKSDNEHLKGEKILQDFEFKKLTLEKTNLQENVKILKANIDEKNNEIKFLNETIDKMKDKAFDDGAVKTSKIGEETLIFQQKLQQEQIENERLSFICKNNSDKFFMFEKELALSKQHEIKLQEMLEQSTKSKDDLLKKLNEEIIKRRSLEDEKKNKQEIDTINSSQLTKLKEENESLKFTLNTLSSKYDNINDELDSKTQDIVRLTSELETYRKINLDLNSKLNSQIERHQIDYKRLNEREDILKQNNLKIASLESEKNDLNSNCFKLKKNLESLTQDFNQLLDAHQNASKENERLKIENNKLNSLKTQINLNNEQYEARFISQQNDISNFGEQYNLLLQKNTNLKNKLNLFRQENEACAQVIATLEKEKSEMNAFINKIKTEYNQLLEKTSTIEVHLNLVNDENNKLKEIISQNKIQVKDLSTNLKANTNIYVNLESQIFDLNKENLKLKKEKEEVLNQINQLIIKLDSYEKHCKLLDTEKLNLEMIIEKERNENINLTKHIQYITSENDFLKKNKDSYNDNTLPMQINQLNTKKRGDEDDIENLKNMIDHFKKENITIKEELNLLRESNMKLSKVSFNQSNYSSSN